MISEPETIDDYIKKEIYCICCNNKIAKLYISDFQNIRFLQHDAKVNGFDIICWSCVQKLRKGLKLDVKGMK